MSAAVHRVLILGDEPMVSALVGLLVEVAGRTPVFANPAESATDALERLRPLSVILLDSTFSASRSDLFFATAARSGIGIAVFGPESNARDIAEIASARNIPWFTIPPTADQLRDALDAAAGRARRERSEDRRSRPVALVAADGTRILLDQTGKRWMVYDRRGWPDRRGARGNRDVVRVFISEAGEAREYGIDEAEAAQASALELERQLAQSTTA